MDELLQRVAEKRGMPASLVERSAKARAEKTGTTLEAVLLEWAGEEPDAGEQTAADKKTTEDTPPTTGEAEKTDEKKTDKGEKSVEVTTDHLVQLAADAKRMPPKLILTSATARAEHSDSSLDEVLADWAGVDLEELKKDASVGTESPETETSKVEAQPPTPSEEKTETAAPVVAAAAAGTITMDELLEKVSETKGMPASLAKRSAEARAKKTGEPVEAVLAEWAGVDPSSISTAPAAPPAEATQDAERRTDDVAAPSSDAKVEVIEASATEPVDEDEGADTTPTTRSRYPGWLAAALVVIPLFGVGYILVVPDGPDCGDASQLLVDPQTGEAVNCDGSEYGTDSVDFLAEGAALYSGCVACHNADGSGGVGPAFTSGAILTTFPAGSCDDHIEWVDLGTSGWPDSTYGATGKTVGVAGLMPAFGGNMTEEQLAAVVLYERVEFGEQPLEEAEKDCGLVVIEDPVEAAGS